MYINSFSVFFQLSTLTECLNFISVFIPLPHRGVCAKKKEALVERLGAGAHPFKLEVGIAPPSVQLIPAKRYTGAPIGTHYDVRVFIADPHVDESVKRRKWKLKCAY